ncbi:hypothetical protein D9M69_636780 [compost metagenome]
MLALQLLAWVFGMPRLNFLVGVLNHHHRGVHHGADGNGDPAQGHDVGVDPLLLHDDEGDEHADR